jgi:hypothetical protein
MSSTPRSKFISVDSLCRKIGGTYLGGAKKQSIDKEKDGYKCKNEASSYSVKEKRNRITI